MFKLKSLFAALALGLGSFAVTAPALAQGTKIVVVDQGRVLRESKAGQDIAQKIRSIETQMQQELKPSAEAVQSIGKSLESKTANMTPEAMRADSALKAEAQSYQQKLSSLEQERRKRAQQLKLTEQQATAAFSKALQPVLDEVMRAQGAQIMLPASQVMVATQAADVTSSVISKLDARTSSIAVSRAELPQQPQQPQRIQQ